MLLVSSRCRSPIRENDNTGIIASSGQKFKNIYYKISDNNLIIILKPSEVISIFSGVNSSLYQMQKSTHKGKTASNWSTVLFWFFLKSFILKKLSSNIKLLTGESLKHSGGYTCRSKQCSLNGAITLQ